MRTRSTRVCRRASFGIADRLAQVFAVLAVSLGAAAAHAVPIQQFCANYGVCLQQWQFESVASGAYRQDGNSNVPSQNYVLGVLADQGGFAGLSVYRNFFMFTPSGVSYGPTTRLIAQLQIRGNLNRIGIQGSERVHIFDPIDFISAPGANVLIDNLVAGTGGIDAYDRLGGAIAFQSDFGVAYTGSNDFLSYGLVDLDIDAIARTLYASNGASNGRLVMGARLEDYSGSPIIGADALEHYLFALTGKNLCPDCGAKLVMAEIPYATQFPIPEPSMAALLAMAGLSSLSLRGRARSAGRRG